MVGNEVEAMVGYQIGSRGTDHNSQAIERLLFYWY